MLASGAVGCEGVSAEARNAGGGVSGLAVLAIVDVTAPIGNAGAGRIEVKVSGASVAGSCALIAIVAVSGDVGSAKTAGNAGAVGLEIKETKTAEANTVTIAGIAVRIQAGNTNII